MTHSAVALFDISLSNSDFRYIEIFERKKDIDMVIFENITINKAILKNIDIDKAILKNININIDIDQDFGKYWCRYG